MMVDIFGNINCVFCFVFGLSGVVIVGFDNN